MRTVTVKNFTQLRKPIAYGGTEGSPIKPAAHATIHKKGGHWIVSLLTHKAAFELSGSDRIQVGAISEAKDAVMCEPNEVHPDSREGLFVTPNGARGYCRECALARDRKRREAKKDLAAQGLDPRQEYRRRLVEQRRADRLARVEAMLSRSAAKRQRTADEEFAVVARNLLFGIASGVEVNPDGSLTSTTGFPAVGQNTPMRGSLAQRRMFALAQFTAACTQHGYTVAQACEFLGVEAEEVSWKQYRTAYPRKRQDDEQEEAA